MECSLYCFMGQSTNQIDYVTLKVVTGISSPSFRFVIPAIIRLPQVAPQQSLLSLIYQII